MEFEDFRIASWSPGVSERPRCLATCHNASTFTVFHTKLNLEWEKKNPYLWISRVLNHLDSVSKLHGFVNLNTKLNFTCRFCQHPDDPIKCAGFLRWFLFTEIAYLISKHLATPSYSQGEGNDKLAAQVPSWRLRLAPQIHGPRLQEMGKHRTALRGTMGRIRQT